MILAGNALDNLTEAIAMAATPARNAEITMLHQPTICIAKASRLN